MRIKPESFEKVFRMPGERVGDAVFVRVQVLKLEDHKMEHAISELAKSAGSQA